MRNKKFENLKPHEVREEISRRMLDLKGLVELLAHYQGLEGQRTVKTSTRGFQTELPGSTEAWDLLDSMRNLNGSIWEELCIDRTFAD